MKIKYEVHNSFLTIKKVEIERETNHSIWLENECGYVRQTRKISDYTNYFDSFSEAKQYLIDRKEKKIKSLQSNLDEEKVLLETIIKLQEKQNGIRS